MVDHTQARMGSGQLLISNPDTKLLDSALLIPMAPLLHNIYNERIAIIGSGPVGLNAAHVLALLGYRHITVFEERATAGGMLAVDMPSFGLSAQAREQLLGLLLRSGGVLHLRTRIGRDISFDEIRRDFDAVLLAVGVQQQVPINLSGEDALEGVYSALEMLSTRPFPSYGGCRGTVVVLGGSRYTFDVAAHAVEAGASSVHVLYPAALTELPVTAREPLLRPHERISIHEFTMPKSFLGTEDMNICGIRCQKTRWIHDDHTSHLACVPGRGRCYPVEAVIVAIGEAPDLSFLPAD